MILCHTPVGSIGADWDGTSITALHWARAGTLTDGPVFDQLKDELCRYFAGKLSDFEVPLNAGGNDFQRRFHRALCDIPYGETRSYGDLAQQLGVSAQAIGQACGANPIPILIPCHRVLGANGLGGYSGAGGIETKVALLKLEGAGSLLI